jgi:TonB dependent receptor-like, beta-barrel/Carboxypeptidase regulatory-like domain
MARLTGLAAAAAILGLTATSASAQGPFTPVRQQAHLMLGSIQGVVVDDRGGPLAGAMVSALGVTSAMTTTDMRGRFVLQPLASGQYVLRINHAGFVSTRREGIRVGAAASDVDRIQLRRAEEALAGRPILAAGMTSLPAGDNPAAVGDNHSETAWRLRHIKRGALKQDGSVVSIADAAAGQEIPDAEPPSIFGRAFDNAANVAASFFTGTPFSGEVNLLTTSSQAAAGPLFFADFAPRGVAYLSIGAPAAEGRWDVRASMSQSDVSAWIVAGTFNTRIASAHDSAFGVSYSTQQYQNPRARTLGLGRAADDARNVGEIYGGDRWTASPSFSLEYGARFAHYDYLRRRSLLSPRVGVVFTSFDDNTHITAHVAQRMLAPGAEEFLAPTMVGPWLPPERTFAPLDGQELNVERSRFFDIGVSHEFGGAYVVGARRFQQRVDNQLVTLFGLPVNGGPESPGHYFVANAGNVDAQGWAFSLRSAPAQRVRGSVEYSVARAQWMSRGDMAAIAVWAPAAIRPHSEDVHDLTTSLETDVRQTDTRVFLMYRLNNAFARVADPSRSPLEYRFDVQVNQALPFMPFSGNARWEVLVGVRNLFRDPADMGSIYDELLVVSPPKRVIGGVLIKF